jgi:hypothetical protein
VEQAQAWLQASPMLLTRSALCARGLQGLRQRLPSLTPEASDAIERLATEWVLGAYFLPLSVQGSWMDSVQDDTVVHLAEDFAVNPVIVAGSRRHFGDAVTLTAWSMREGAERTLNGSLIYEAAFCLGLDHPQVGRPMLRML